MSGRVTRTLLTAGALILLVAFWTAAWRGMDRSVLSQAPILDEAHYLERAVEISNEGWIPDDVFTMSPLYSYLVAATGSGRTLDAHRLREGAPPRGIRWLQAILWLGTAWTLWRVGRDLLGPRWCWGPPLLWMGYAPAAILAGQVLMEIPLTFAAALALGASGSHLGPRSRWGRGVLAGAMVGVAVLLRGTAIVLVIPVILALWQESSPRRIVGVVVPVVVAIVVVVAPFVLHNSLLAGRPAPPAMNVGVNLLIGNGPGANGFFRVFQGFDFESDPSGAAYLSAKLGRPIGDPWTADRAWTEEARTVMTADPIRVLGLWSKKVRLHLVGVEIPQISSFGAWSKHVPLFRVLVVPWALLAAAGLAGGIMAWRSVPGMRPWLVAALLLIAVQSLFFVVTRYRIILVPGLALGATVLARELVRRRGSGLVATIVVMIASAVFVWPWGLTSTLQQFEAGGWDNEAVRWEHVASACATTNPSRADRSLAEAEALYRRSLELVPHRPHPWQGLARIHRVRGDHEEALSILIEGLSSAAATRDLRRDLIGMLLQLERTEQALPHLDLALRDAPEDAELLHNTVIALAGAGRLEPAVEMARKLIAVHPEDPRGYLDLGVLLGRSGRLEEAGGIFAAGLELSPDHPELSSNLERVRHLLGDAEK